MAIKIDKTTNKRTDRLIYMKEMEKKQIHTELLKREIQNSQSNNNNKRNERRKKKRPKKYDGRKVGRN